MSSSSSAPPPTSSQPGQTWTVLTEEETSGSITLPLGFGFIALLVFTAMGCGLQNICRRRGEADSDDDSSLGYSVAVSNSLQKEEGSGRPPGKTCMNCILIEMGEMVCYSERCPDCGRVPPGRRKKHQERFKKLMGRKVPAKKPQQRGAAESHDQRSGQSYLAYRDRHLLQEDCIV